MYLYMHATEIHIEPGQNGVYSTATAQPAPSQHILQNKAWPSNQTTVGRALSLIVGALDGVLWT